MKVLILAGGKGTRLQTVLPDRPKPMALIGDKPFLACLLDRLHQAGLHRVTLSLGHMAQQIEQHFGTRYRDIHLHYVIESAPLGTGGAVSLALAGQADTPWLVLNGDTLFELDYHAFIAHWQQRPQHIALALTTVPDSARYGRVQVRDQAGGPVVLGFTEKGGSGAGLINAGSLILRENDLLPHHLPAVFSLERDFLQAHCASLLPSAFIASGNFIDIGVPDDLLRAQSCLPAWNCEPSP